MSVLQISAEGLEVSCDMNYDKYGGKVLCEVRGKGLPPADLVRRIIDRPGLTIENFGEVLRLTISVEVFERRTTPGEVVNETVHVITCIKKLADVLGLSLEQYRLNARARKT